VGHHWPTARTAFTVRRILSGNGNHHRLRQPKECQPGDSNPRHKTRPHGDAGTLEEIAGDEQDTAYNDDR